MDVASNSSSSASWTSPGAGITGGYDGDSETLKTFIVFFAGLAMYNACELIVIVLLTFKRFRGCYFWSLLISGIAIIPYALGFLLKFRNITTGNLRWLAVVLLTVGWYPMITGQALVLWSRLHLILSGEKGDRIIFWTKWMIIIDAIIFHIPTTVLTFGSNGTIDTRTFEVGYNIMEKIQMIGFFIQEFVLSSIYIVETLRILRTSLQEGTRRTMKQLVFINVVIILMDLALLGLECASLYILETLLKGVIYSIKLKLEFAILSKLVKFVGGTKLGQDVRKSSVGFLRTSHEMSKAEHDMDVADFVDLDRVSTDLTHPSRSYRYSSSLPSRRKTSRVPDEPGFDFDYNVARFEHIEDVSSLRDERPKDPLSPRREGQVCTCHFLEKAPYHSGSRNIVGEDRGNGGL